MRAPPNEEGSALSTASPSRRVQVRVPAKINLHLGVGPLRPDRYHELATVFCAISLYDELTATPGTRPGVALTVEGAPRLPTDARNLAVRAARVLAGHAGLRPAVQLHLRKGIPVSGGMAGGSADAAAALVACDALWELATPPEELQKLAVSLGSDVAFPLLGGVALGTGRGDVLEPLAAPHRRHWVVALADYGLATPAVYAETDRRRGAAATTATASDPDRVIVALADPDPAVLGTALTNDLQPAALALRPELEKTLDTGREAGALGAMVSGSGPTCVFLAANASHASALDLALAGTAAATRTAWGPVPGATVVSG
ncbi:MAG TPA: 4-(cytidine 5'-diphospho)-2-C-methyl-D-erythritol kinase [Cryptosporangiaceae bacterium]|nr:4-(cytidine 5'-diphospho)-2-C-methyl-D-erythritol kinase [Cryptosporangiaceae bacterium]